MFETIDGIASDSSESLVVVVDVMDCMVLVVLLLLPKVSSSVSEQSCLAIALWVLCRLFFVLLLLLLLYAMAHTSAVLLLGNVR